MYRVAQFSDTHFALKGNRSHGGFGYDTDLAWQRVSTQAFTNNSSFDAAVITGDLVDHGLPAEYDHALGLLQSIPVSTNLVPGNHDFDAPLRSSVAGSKLAMERELRVGPWQFLFVDTNGEFGDTEQRIESNGRLSEDELDWLNTALSKTDAKYSWLWMHHPPAMAGTWAHCEELDDQLEALVTGHSSVQGIGAGHVHMKDTRMLGGKPVVTCPAFTINFDLGALTTKPPGWRSWNFHDDGTFDTECHFVDEEDAWPVFDLPQPVIDYQLGKSNWHEMQAYMEELMAMLSSDPAPPASG